MLSYTPPQQSSEFEWDSSQFKLQADGTFRISIRGMAAMAGVDQSGLTRSLKSAEDENPLPCAKYLVGEGLSPEDVSTWGETGGIPEDAVPFILEHYSSAKSHAGDSEAANGKARWARRALLSFARVGVNAVLREKLGLPPLSQVRDTQLATQEHDDWTWRLDICERIGIRFDERDKLQLKEAIVGQKLLAAGSSSMVYADIPVSRAVQEVFSGLVLPLEKLKKIGWHLARWYKEERGVIPVKHDQYVDGANRLVNTYPRDWILGTLPRLAKTYPDLFAA